MSKAHPLFPGATPEGAARAWDGMHPVGSHRWQARRRCKSCDHAQPPEEARPVPAPACRRGVSPVPIRLN